MIDALIDPIELILLGTLLVLGAGGLICLNIWNHKIGKHLDNEDAERIPGDW